MVINQHKLARQKIGVGKWFNNNCFGTLEYVTGVGKTYTAILCMIRYLKDINANASFIVVVPTDPLRTMWREELKAHRITNVKVDTIHMLAKESLTCDMIILDELHKYLGEDAEVFPLIFENTNFNACLGLTATLGRDGLQNELVDRYCPVVDTIDLTEALENEYVSPYITYNLGIPLSQSDSIAYAKINNSFYRFFGLFNNSFDQVKACLTDAGAERFARRIHWEKGAVIGYAVKAMKYMRLRKQFLYGVDTKLDTAKQIMEKFHDKKIIIFSQTTEPADKLARLVDGCESYHSNIETRLYDKDMTFMGEKVSGVKDAYKIFETDDILSWKEVKKKYDYTRCGTKKLREKILNDFKSGKIKYLSTAQALDVGYDDDNIDGGIIMSATSKQRQDIQRSGRVIRVKEGKRAFIVQLYITDTQDEKWLKGRQTNTENVKNIYSVSQIEV